MSEIVWDDEVKATQPTTKQEGIVWDDERIKPAKPDGGWPAGGVSATDSIRKAAENLAGGVVRGAGSIGATLLTPLDRLAQYAGIQNDYIGRSDRREAMDSLLKDSGFDTGSFAFGAGKLGSEVAGTAGIPGVLGNAITKAAPLLSSAMPRTAAYLPRLAESVASGGFKAGGLTGLPGWATRLGGGAITGGATAGMVDPDHAGAGTLIGAATPVAVSAAGKVGTALGDRFKQGAQEALDKFNRTAPMRQTLKESVDAGYVVPPNMVNPSTKNALIESFSGKQATSQLASVRNQDVTEKLVRQSLGLADDVPLTRGALEQIRTIEGGAYKKVANLSPKAEIDLEALKTARNEAQAWFNSYNRSAHPEHLANAKNARDLAEVLELQLESHAANAGKSELIPALREARKMIAKTYTVERALNDASGTVNARVLGRLYEKGKPLSDGLDTVGKFASAFPSVANAPQQIGSPAAHNLRAMLSMAMGGAGSFAAGPSGLAAAALPFAAGAASRGLMFREGAQRALANQSAPLSSKVVQQLGLLDPTLIKMLSTSGAATTIPAVTLSQ